MDERRTNGEITQLLALIRSGQDSVASQVLPLIYSELQGLARQVFSNQNRSHTLQPTALVHEAWIKLAGNLGSVDDRRHFLVLAGMAMRQVLVDHARSRRAQKRGEGASKQTLIAGEMIQGKDGIDFVELDDSLRALAERNPRHGRIAELRILSGLTLEEVALELSVSRRTAESDWAMAKVWLRKHLSSSPDNRPEEA